MNNKPTNFVKVSSTEDDLSALASHFKARAEAAEAEKVVAYDSGYAAGLEAAAEVCTRIIKDYDVMKPDGKTYEPMRVQKAAKGMVSLAREDIRAMKPEGKK